MEKRGGKLWITSDVLGCQVVIVNIVNSIESRITEEISF